MDIADRLVLVAEDAVALLPVPNRNGGRRVDKRRRQSGPCAVVCLLTPFCLRMRSAPVQLFFCLSLCLERRPGHYLPLEPGSSVAVSFPRRPIARLQLPGPTRDVDSPRTLDREDAILAVEDELPHRRGRINLCPACHSPARVRTPHSYKLRKSTPTQLAILRETVTSERLELGTIGIYGEKTGRYAGC
jgi:hypothetical protein